MWWLLGTAQAFDFDRDADGAPIVWPAFPVAAAWTADAPGPPGAERALTVALAQWSAVPGAAVALEAHRGPGCALPVASPFDPANCTFPLEPWPFDPDVLALSTTWSDPDGIVSFDIAVHTARPWRSPETPGGFDLGGALAHEVGHALGLEHSFDPDATMAPALRPGEAGARTLSVDDQDGARFLYPSAPDPFGCAHAPSAGPLLLPALLIRRRRRR